MAEPASGSFAELCTVVINTSEKAAMVARALRSGGKRRLSITRKMDLDKGCDKAVADFFTIADVLVQRVVEHELERQLPGILVSGEEDADAQLADSSEPVQVKSTEDETRAALVGHLGDVNLANKVAAIIHGPVHAADTAAMEAIAGECNYADLGVWIDPIDCTNAYIKGGRGTFINGICAKSGLQAVTVLLGVYIKATGEPLMGSVNQPFWRQGSQDVGDDVDHLNLDDPSAADADASVPVRSRGSSVTRSPIPMLATLFSVAPAEDEGAVFAQASPPQTDMPAAGDAILETDAALQHENALNVDVNLPALEHDFTMLLRVESEVSGSRRTSEGLVDGGEWDTSVPAFHSSEDMNLPKRTSSAFLENLEEDDNASDFQPPEGGATAADANTESRKARMSCARTRKRMSSVADREVRLPWEGRQYWGLVGLDHGGSGSKSHAGCIPLSVSNGSAKGAQGKPIIVHSKHESKSILDSLQGISETMIVPGSGYKGLCVLSGAAEAYYLSLPTTYRWDTCACQAVVVAMGGIAVRASDGEAVQYNGTTKESFVNEGGIILCSSRAMLDRVQEAVSNPDRLLSGDGGQTQKRHSENTLGIMRMETAAGEGYGC